MEQTQKTVVNGEDGASSFASRFELGAGRHLKPCGEDLVDRFLQTSSILLQIANAGTKIKLCLVPQHIIPFPGLPL